MAKTVCIQSITIWDSCRIHCLSFVFGVWVVLKSFVKWIWDPNGFFKLQLRDNPPACLLDPTLGQHKYVKLKNVKLHYVESGSKEKPLILLLHGFPDFWLSWRHQIPILSQHFRVVSLDLKGFGDSDKPLWRRNYRLDLILNELEQFIRSLHVQNCTIIGHDLGALIGWYFAHQMPHMVDKFFAVSCPHPNIFWNNSYNYQWVNFVQLPYLPEIDALKEDVRIINDYHKHLPMSEHLEAYKYAFSRKEDWTGPINYYRNLPFNKIEETQQVLVPTILISGNKDNQIPLESMVKSSDYCDKFHLKIVENTGHFPHQENPQLFNNIILKYLLKCKTETDNKMDKSLSSKSLMQGLFGAVSNTVKYGNSVIDSVQKRTNGVVNSIPSIGISLNYNNATDN